LLDIKEHLKYLKTIISFDDLPSDLIDQIKAKGLKYLNFHDIIDKHEEDDKFIEPKPNNIYTICYTSGTTGNPKGVKISHQNIVALIQGISWYSVFSKGKDRMISFLPLAHMAERT